jgi:hypothetical protein
MILVKWIWRNCAQFYAILRFGAKVGVFTNF